MIFLISKSGGVIWRVVSTAAKGLGYGISRIWQGLPAFLETALVCVEAINKILECSIAIQAQFKRLRGKPGKTQKGGKHLGKAHKKNKNKKNKRHHNAQLH